MIFVLFYDNMYMLSIILRKKGASSMEIKQFIRHYPFSAKSDGDMEIYDLNREKRIISERYEAEERLLNAIASGDESAAVEALTAYGELMSSPSQTPKPTSPDNLRDFKNSVLVMNTLFRKAIERGHVHPIYLHSASSDFGARIEKTENMAAFEALIREMIATYCRLVREYSLSAYSAPVRKAIIFIDLNLSSPISTREIAADQFITPNYLSARFKQETGKNVTDYILERRVSIARKLLTTSSLSVQSVASAVGIDDASYFSKQFKRIIGLSPLQYRSTHRRA